MSNPRFRVLPDNQLTVWDESLHTCIHLGSRVDAEELAELLNLMDERIQELTEANIACACTCICKQVDNTEEDQYMKK